MITNCQEINLLLELCKKDGNSILEADEGWSKIDKVIYMKKSLSPEVKFQIEKQKGMLRYRNFQGSFHYPADEGFVCDEHSIAISFPVKK